jgi:hypothetical protein
MGTNYHLKTSDPRFSDPEAVHIGKSSGGWCFMLHIYPELRICTLDDWRPLIEAGSITDSNGVYTAPDTMLRIITERSWAPQPDSFTPQRLAANHATPGPNGLLRQQIDGTHCVGHGEGTWDLMVGVFS